MSAVVDYPDDPQRTFPTNDPHVRRAEFGTAGLVTYTIDDARQTVTLTRRDLDRLTCLPAVTQINANGVPALFRPEVIPRTRFGVPRLKKGPAMPEPATAPNGLALSHEVVM